MKKFTLLMCMMTICVGTAFSETTVSIPFFADEVNGIRAFVGLQNVGEDSITITASYLNASGAGAASGGTFTLAPGASISYRPAFAGGGEVQAAGLLDAPAGYGGLGSITFLIPGGAKVAGRYIQFSSNGTVFGHNLERQ